MLTRGIGFFCLQSCRKQAQLELEDYAPCGRVILTLGGLTKKKPFIRSAHKVLNYFRPSRKQASVRSQNN